MKKVLKKRTTKKLAETYEVLSTHKGYREFLVFYPQAISDPFYEGDMVAVARLDKKGLFITTYPYKYDHERQLMLDAILGGYTVLGEVIL